MTTDTPPIDSDAARWALHSLRIDEATAAPSVADLLRRVTEWEYVIPPEAIDAVRLLANRQGPDTGSNFASQAEGRGREQRLEADVAGFATSFFDLSPNARLARWQALTDECRDIPALAGWLSDLKPGLNVISMPTAEDERFNELVKECREIFVMRRLAGIRRRQEFIALCREDRRVWETVSRKLQSKHPLFTGYVAAWVIRLQRFEDPVIQVSRKPSAASAQPGGSRSHTGTWVAVVLIAALLRIVGATLRPTPPAPPAMPASQSFRPPSPVMVRPEDEPVLTLPEGVSKEGIEKFFQEYPELRKRFKPNDSPGARNGGPRAPSSGPQSSNAPQR